MHTTTQTPAQTGRDRQERRMVHIKVPIGYKFILGFIAVVASAAFVPDLVEQTNVAEWLREPLSFLTAIVVGLILGSIFTRNFTRNFNNLTSAAKKISVGDLTGSPGLERASTIFQDETGELEDAIRAMSTNLRGLVEHIKETGTNLAEAQEMFSTVVARGHETSKDVISGTSIIFDGALEQANHIGDVSTTVKTMAEIADDVATKVTETANGSQKVNAMVQRGATATTSAMEKMETIFKGIENTESAANRLKEKLNDIPRILDVITHISRQTDLLALNATIEASKAGEHGRGFAMVADEVRRFADNTNHSVEDVALIVKELKIEVERVVASASEGTSNLKGGRDDLRKIREILVDITNYTSDVVEKSTLVLGLTHKQKEKAGKSVEIIEQVARIARGNLTTTENVEAAVERHGAVIKETMAASEKLSELSRELKEVVARFILD
ncbi:MAG: methyl-accepting chemotaxis protein [Thermodesulfobacteriota bacterium]|nr:MAG: methyl-accepting chemotaxis protein [Thermodesulfobacteriota bacterium]